jgi:hypothetical protein
MSLSNNIISFIISFIIMIFIPVNVVIVMFLIFRSNLKSALRNKWIKTDQIRSFIQLFIGIIILFYSLYFNTKIWGIPAGGGIIIIGTIFRIWMLY